MQTFWQCPPISYKVSANSRTPDIGSGVRLILRQNREGGGICLSGMGLRIWVLGFE
jgi:hypothetical protein